MPSPALVAVLAFLTAAPVWAQSSVEGRLDATSSLLGEGDTYAMVGGARVTLPLAWLTPPDARLQAQVLAFGGIAGLRTRADRYPGEFEEESPQLGYRDRTQGMAEAGLTARMGWVEVSAGPSLRVRDEAFVRSVRYNADAEAYDVEVLKEARTDIGYLIETGVRIPFDASASVGAHLMLRRYDAGTPLVGVGLSGTLSL